MTNAAVPSLCDAIEPTAMAFLDDELATEERRELELHLLACARCREHVDRERAELDLLRARLGAAVATPPPISDLFAARLARGLDGVDAETAAVATPPPKRSMAARRWMLPGAAALAAAAALAVFVALPPSTGEAVDPVAREAVRHEQRHAPLEVQGVSTGPWLAQHFRADVAVPSFPDDRARLQGARLTAIAGQPAAQLVYDAGGARLVAFVVDGVRLDAGGSRVVVDGRALRVLRVDGAATITYVDPAGRGYVFTSAELSEAGLLEVVVASNLIGDAGRRVR